MYSYFLPRPIGTYLMYLLISFFRKNCIILAFLTINSQSIINLFSPLLCFCFSQWECASNELQHSPCPKKRVFLAWTWVFLVWEIISAWSEPHCWNFPLLVSLSAISFLHSGWNYLNLTSIPWCLSIHYHSRTANLSRHHSAGKKTCIRISEGNWSCWSAKLAKAEAWFCSCCLRTCALLSLSAANDFCSILLIRQLTGDWWCPYMTLKMGQNEECRS